MARELKFANEGHVKKQIKKLLDAHDWFWWMPAGSAFGSTGVSDFCAIKQGTFMAVEAKFGKNHATAMQVAYVNSIRQADGFGFYVNETNLDSFKAWLEAFDRSVAATSRGEKVAPEDGAMMLNAMNEIMKVL